MIFKFKRKLFNNKDKFGTLSQKEQEVRQIEEQVKQMTTELDMEAFG